MHDYLYIYIYIDRYKHSSPASCSAGITWNHYVLPSSGTSTSGGNSCAGEPAFGGARASGSQNVEIMTNDDVSDT